MGLLLPQGQDVQFPVMANRQDQPGDGVGHQEAHVDPAPAGEAAHDPEDDGRQRLFVETLHQADEGGEKGAHHDARQDQGLLAEAPRLPGQDQDRGHGPQGAHQGRQGQGAQAQETAAHPQHHQQGHAKGGAGGDPQGEGVGQGVQQSPWKTTPAVASEAPTRPARTTRDSRMPQMTTSVVRSRAGVEAQFAQDTSATVCQPISMRPMPVARATETTSPRLRARIAATKRRLPAGAGSWRRPGPGAGGSGGEAGNLQSARVFGPPRYGPARDGRSGFLLPQKKSPSPCGLKDAPSSLSLREERRLSRATPGSGPFYQKAPDLRAGLLAPGST